RPRAVSVLDFSDCRAISLPFLSPDQYFDRV
ncbi:MAG: hypothetical protein ACI92A_002686, partial [Candidatus Paceibacteria bacterium]